MCFLNSMLQHKISTNIPNIIAFACFFEKEKSWICWLIFLIMIIMKLFISNPEQVRIAFFQSYYSRWLGDGWMDGWMMDTIFWVHILVRYFMDPIWIWGCQIASKKRVLLSDTQCKRQTKVEKDKSNARDWRIKILTIFSCLCDH